MTLTHSYTWTSETQN